MIIKAKRYETVSFQGKSYARTFSDGSRAVPERDRTRLDALRAAILNRKFLITDYEFFNQIYEVDLGYMTAEELQAVCDPRFVVGVDFKTIDTTPPFTSKEMNDLYPGAVDAVYWKTVFANQSLFWSKHTETLDTSIGIQTVTTEVYRNAGVEDIMTANTIAQGINLQNILLSQKTLATNYRFRYNPVNNPIEYTYLED